MPPTASPATSPPSRRPGMFEPAPAPTADRRSDLNVEASEEGAHPGFDLVTDRTDGVQTLTGGIVELPVLVPLARDERAAVAAAPPDDDVGGGEVALRPPPGRAVGDVHADFGHGGDGRRVDRSAGLAASGEGHGPVPGEGFEPTKGHPGAAGVVDAQEEHGRDGHERSAPVWGTTTSSAGRAGWRNFANATARPPPSNWAAMNAGAEDGLMPANVSVSVRARVTAGLANDVE